MNISFINDEFSDSIGECVFFCHRNKIKFIEIRKIEGKDICEFSDKEIANISDILEKNNIAVSCVDSRVLKKENFPFLTTENEKKVNLALSRAIDVAKILKTTNIRIFSGVKSSDFSFKKLALFLLSKSDILNESGVNLLIENEKTCNIATLADLNCFFEKFSLPRIFPLIDFGNAVNAGEKDSLKQCFLLKDLCRYYHIKDMDTENNYCAIGSGIFDFKSLKENIDKLSFISLEQGTRNKNEMEISVQYLKENF